ncbi:MAG: cytochrome-c oxidase, cbb3-type subunit III [Pseudomonadota bacterium]
MTDHPNEKDVDAHSGVETTGHVWDGIRELNNPLPRVWLIIWYISIVWAIVYMVLMPALPALPFINAGHTPGLRGHSDRALVSEAMASLEADRTIQSASLLEASLDEIETDRNLQQFALAMGESLFGDNCATCHGSGGRGVIGYPSLADDVWLWDGSLDGIETTLRHGIRQPDDDATRFSLMPSYGRDGLLTTAQISDLTDYVLHFTARTDDRDAVARAETLFAQQCSVCHGASGRGDRSIGAPNLTDHEWLYGGDRDNVYDTIYNARNSHMPAWSGRLDDASIKALSVYVHSLGGGE